MSQLSGTSCKMGHPNHNHFQSTVQHQNKIFNTCSHSGQQFRAAALLDASGPGTSNPLLEVNLQALQQHQLQQQQLNNNRYSNCIKTISRFSSKILLHFPSRSSTRRPNSNTRQPATTTASIEISSGISRENTTQQSQPNQHLQPSLNNNNFKKCPLCEEAFSDPLAFQLHLRNHILMHQFAALTSNNLIM